VLPGQPVQPELLAVGYSQHDRGETVVLCGRLPHDAPDRRHVLVGQWTPQPVNHQLLDKRLHELLGPLEDDLAEGDRTIDIRPAGKHGGGVDRQPALAILLAPTADRVEVLEREAIRVHAVMAAAARWARPVRLEPFAD